MTKKRILSLQACDGFWITKGLFHPDELRIRDLFTYKPEEIGTIIFGGGVDVDPKLYNEPVGYYTQAPNRNRDETEALVFKYAVQHNIPMIGLCRGAQLLTVLAGGKLIQHVNNHAGHDHKMLTTDGHTVRTNSYHHQMCFPWTSKQRFSVLAKAAPSLATMYLAGDNDPIRSAWKLEPDFMRDVFCEPEVIWWPEIKALCIQGHPEWTRKGEDLNIYANKLVEQHIIPHVYPASTEKGS